MEIIILIGVVAIIFIILKRRYFLRRTGGYYEYRKKEFLMTRAEHECFDALMTAVGDKYYVFPQVHLSDILDHQVKGQGWQGARSHINRKSVDFVLCDKSYISPKLAIELDDKSHERQNRIERDAEVERILKEAGLPLLRLNNHGSFVSSELLQEINRSLL